MSALGKGSDPSEITPEQNMWERAESGYLTRLGDTDEFHNNFRLGNMASRR